MNEVAHIDTSRWDWKTENIKAALLPAIKKVVEQGHDWVMISVNRNIKGPAYGYTLKTSKTGKTYIQPNRGPQTGRMPIPRITGMLARSVRTFRASPALVAIIGDKRIAAHAPRVHDNPKNPRPFIEQPILQNKRPIYVMWNHELLKVLRELGLER